MNYDNFLNDEILSEVIGLAVEQVERYLKAHAEVYDELVRDYGSHDEVDEVSEDRVFYCYPSSVHADQIRDRYYGSEESAKRRERSRDHRGERREYLRDHRAERREKSHDYRGERRYAVRNKSLKGLYRNNCNPL